MPVAIHAGGHAAIHGGTHGSAAANPRLANAAHEFEAQLMKELMKPLTSGVAPGDDGDDDDGDAGTGSTGALGEFASEALAKALSEQGGFGIADKILAQFASRDATETAAMDSQKELARLNGKDRAKSTTITRK